MTAVGKNSLTAPRNASLPSRTTYNRCSHEKPRSRLRPTNSRQLPGFRCCQGQSPARACGLRCRCPMPPLRLVAAQAEYRQASTHTSRRADPCIRSSSTNLRPASCHSRDTLERLTPGEFGFISSTSRVLTPDNDRLNDLRLEAVQDRWRPGSWPASTSWLRHRRTCTRTRGRTTSSRSPS